MGKRVTRSTTIKLGVEHGGADAPRTGAPPPPPLKGVGWWWSAFTCSREVDQTVDSLARMDGDLSRLEEALDRLVVDMDPQTLFDELRRSGVEDATNQQASSPLGARNHLCKSMMRRAASGQSAAISVRRSSSPRRFRRGDKPRRSVNW